MKLSKHIRRGLALTVGFLWMLSLDSCTIYKDPLLVKYDDVNQRRELEDILAKSKHAVAPAPVPSAAVVDPPKVRIEACSKFVLPPNGQIPRLTQKQIGDISTSVTPEQLKQARDVLVDELEKIYKYTSAEENALNITYVKHLKSCHRVTVEK